MNERQRISSGSPFEPTIGFGISPDHVVRTRTFLVDRHDAGEVGRAHGEVFEEIRPASTMVVVKELLDPRWRVEIEAEAEA